MEYKEVITTAVLFFPFIAFIFTLPYIIYNYHKYGSLTLIRIIIVYSFILYLLVAFFLVILPLPSFDEVLLLNSPTTQLIPFNFVKDIITEGIMKLNGFSNFLSLFKMQVVYQVLYNVLITLPLGVYLRYYYKASFKKTVLIGFLISLFFELTQLTGLFFIYPRPYRLFDVDDLILNTCGAMLGFAITPFLTFILPKKDELDSKSYKKGQRVTFIKRGFTFLLDLFFLSLLRGIEYFFIPWFNNNSIYGLIINLFIIFVLIPMIKKGSTLGSMITRYSIRDVKNKQSIKWYQVLIRNVLKIYLFVPFIYYLLEISYLITEYYSNNLRVVCAPLVVLLIMAYLLLILIRNLILKKPFLYESISKTTLVSTIKIPDDKSKK